MSLTTKYQFLSKIPLVSKNFVYFAFNTLLKLLILFMIGDYWTKSEMQFHTIK